MIRQVRAAVALVSAWLLASSAHATGATSSNPSIARDAPVTQTASLESKRTFNPDSIEEAFGRLTMLVQQWSGGIILPSSLGQATAVLRQTSKTCKVDHYSGADLGAQLAAALADASCTSRIYDATDLGGPALSISSPLLVKVSGAVVLWPNADVTLGGNSIIVPAGTHNVAFFCAAPYGSPAGGVAVGTRLSYTGNGTAVQVGSSASDTHGFVLQDCSININRAGNGAIGLQLNRATQYHLIRLRVTGLLAANTQKDIDLEGAANYTGGVIESAHIDNGNTGVYFGKNANANTLVHPWISLQNAGIGLNFAGDVTGPLNGNTVIGGDIENCTTVVNFDYASDNSVWGLRAEKCRNAVTATANSLQNIVFSNGTTHLMAISDSGTNNAFTDTYYAQFNRTKWQLRNATDTNTDLTLSGGATANQVVALNFADRGTVKYILRKNNDNTLSIVNLATATNRLSLGTVNTAIDSESEGQVKLNANAGTGGVCFGSGAGSCVATVDSAGRLAPGTFTNATLGAPSNGKIVYCSDCSISNPCAGGGTGAIAKRLNGVWVCN